MSLLKEFREFIIRGNAIDMAVAIVVGTAFTAMVTSLVNDVLMPPLGALMADVNFSDLAYTVKEAEGDKKAVVIGFGKLINAIIALVVQGFVVFMIVKSINSMKKKKEEAAPATPADVQLLTEIRDLLKKNSA
ncbi:MAG: large-conductance mechanosensitive channel protein MscL [Pirellulales bacterium]